MTVPADPVLRHARWAVSAAFIVSGLVLGSFFARTPAVRDTLGLTPAQLGLLLLCASFGSIAGLPVSGPVVARIGPGRTVLGGVLVNAVGLAGIGGGLGFGSAALTAPGLFLFGLGLGTWDVAMNVEGADVERRLGRTLMPRLHAGFSLGTVAGAAVGAGTAALGLPVAVQVLALAVLAPAVLAGAVRRFVGGPAPAADRESATGAFGVRQAWREPRTLLVGLMALGFAFTEGSANDWMAVAMVDGYGTGETVGALGFGVFVAAMTVGRVLGGTVLDRFGRVPVIRLTAALGLAGLLLVLLGGSPEVAIAGAALWGLGASLGFPVGMSAAADDPARAAVRVSVVSSIGYTAFLAGPPLIGFLAEHVGILRGLFVVVAALTLGLLASSAARPLPTPAPASIPGEEPARP